MGMLDEPGGFSDLRPNADGDWAYGSCDLSGRGLDSIAELAGYKNLSCVNVSRNNISSIPDLTEMANLQSLNMDDNSVSEFGSSIKGLAALRTLSMQNNSLVEQVGEDVAPALSGLPPSIQTLLLSGNQLVSVTSIDALAELRTLDLSRNKMNAGLAGLNCAELKELNCADNRLMSTEGLEGSVALTTLDLSGNRIEAVTSLGEGHEALKTINLRDNKIGSMASIECLSALPALTSLVLAGNPIAEIPDYKKKVVAALKQLKHLDDEDILQQERDEIEEWDVAEQARLAALAEENAE